MSDLNSDSDFKDVPLSPTQELATISLVPMWRRGHSVPPGYQEIEHTPFQQAARRGSSVPPESQQQELEHAPLLPVRRGGPPSSIQDDARQSRHAPPQILQHPQPLRGQQQQENGNVANELTLMQKLNFIILGVWVFCGTPLLSIPFAVREGGWFGILFFVIFIVFTFGMAFILPYIIRNGESSYEEICNTIFGVRGRISASVISFIFSYATCIDSVIIKKDNLSHMCSGGAVAIVFLILISGFLLCSYNFNEYDPLLPGIGLSLTVVVVGCMVVLGISDIGFKGETELYNSSTMHLAVGFYAYCLCGHAYLPRMYTSINDRNQYWSIIKIIFVISTFLYVVTGCIAYAMYGLDVDPIFTLNFQPNSTVSQIAIYSTVICHIIRYLLNLSTLATTLEGLFPEERRTRLCKNLIRLGLTLSTFLAFYGVPYYASLVSYSGSSIGVLMSLMIPSTCFRRIIRRNELQDVNVSRMTRFLGHFSLWAFIVGCVAAVLTYSRNILGMKAA